ncbi:hypothetical protein HK105_207529 [Polyrhizophydium stewartii]|uniref:PIN-like protein n=1 Tax=Polyrhizophydium stewartii TaxID=2732419 RepID=A0ABR4N0G2_9FUNG
MAEPLVVAAAAVATAIGPHGASLLKTPGDALFRLSLLMAAVRIVVLPLLALPGSAATLQRRVSEAAESVGLNTLFFLALVVGFGAPVAV